MLWLTFDEALQKWHKFNLKSSNPLASTKRGERDLTHTFTQDLVKTMISMTGSVIVVISPHKIDPKPYLHKTSDICF